MTFTAYATRQVDVTSERPIVVPAIRGGASRSPAWGRMTKTKVTTCRSGARFTGTVLPGGVLWFEDDNIPTYGTTSQTQLVVSARQTRR